MNWKLTLLCVLTFPLLVGLGLWQLDRAEFKRTQQARLEAVQTRPPAQLPGESVSELQPQRRLVLQGHYRPERQWLLDNRHRDGRVGYEVITPFELTDGRVLLVNRGWVAGSADRHQRPDPDAPEGSRTLFAQWRQVSEHPLLEGSAGRDAWPRVVLAVVPERMAPALEGDSQVVTAGYARLEAASPGALATDWPSNRIDASRHTAYAVQWFAMALAVVIWFVLANTPLGARLGRHRDR